VIKLKVLEILILLAGPKLIKSFHKRVREDVITIGECQNQRKT
jgi:hypothetical protein